MGTTKRVSGGGKDASFTLTIPRQSVNYKALTVYAEDEAELNVNLNEGAGLDATDGEETPDKDQMALQEAA